MTVQIATYYQFLPIAPERVESLMDSLTDLGNQHHVRGLTILATEGINATVAGQPENLKSYLAAVETLVGLTEPIYKFSTAERMPFHEFKVKLRPEIVTLHTPDLVPTERKHRHLTPEEWHKALTQEDVVVIDTRNEYETRIGKFKGAIDPKIDEFGEFPEFLKQAPLDKNKKTLIYCTGGIRCEKAILEMEKQGFQNVYQLEGGILNYLKEFPHQTFEGECFIFDYRVALDQNLNPTQNYRLCPHCGCPAKTKIVCKQCGVEETVCEDCLSKGGEHETCSKNCAHHFRMGHKSRRIHLDSFKKRGIKPEIQKRMG